MDHAAPQIPPAALLYPPAAKTRLTDRRNCPAVSACQQWDVDRKRCDRWYLATHRSKRHGRRLDRHWCPPLKPLNRWPAPATSRNHRQLPNFDYRSAHLQRRRKSPGRWRSRANSSRDHHFAPDKSALHWVGRCGRRRRVSSEFRANSVGLPCFTQSNQASCSDCRF